MSNTKNRLGMFRFYSIIVLLFVFQFKPLVGQTPWIVPDDKKTKLSPVEFNDSIRKQGNEIFQANCVSCHGQPGLGNVAQLVPLPPDPVSAKMQQNTDGEMFYKIAEGRGQMSSFKNVLTPNEIWDVIAYMRSFNKGYVQQIEEIIEKGGYDGVIKIILSFIKDKKIIEAKITGTKAQHTEPLENVEVKLLAQRRFGTLQIDETKTTNSSGIVKFDVSQNLPGDSIGMVQVIALLSDQELYGRVKTDTLFAIGTPTNLPGLTEKRAIWNTMAKAPYWLLITYFGGVLAAWGAIFYILMQIRKIYYIGKNNA